MANSPERDHRGKGRSFTIGALIGALTGAVAGILFAPKSGRETRADLKEKAQDIESETREKATEVKQKAHQTTEEAKATGKRWSKKARDAAQAIEDKPGNAGDKEE